MAGQKTDTDVERSNRVDEALLRKAAENIRMPGGPPDGDTLAAGRQTFYDFPGDLRLPKSWARKTPFEGGCTT